MARADLLLVDASLGQRTVLQRMLAANGFTVAAFADLRKPSARIATQRFDHAVLDLRLPDRGGLGSIRSLREARPQARIIVVTASTASPPSSWRCVPVPTGLSPSRG